MKKKSSTKPVRRSLGKGGSTDARHSLSTRRSSAIARRTRLGEGGFINLRMVLGLTLALSGIALAIFAGKDVAVPRASEPERYMPVPGAKGQSESAALEQLEQYWHDRLTFPTGRFDPAWVRAAVAQHDRMTTGVPAGQHLKLNRANPNALSTDQFYRTRSATAANDWLFGLFRLHDD